MIFHRGIPTQYMMRKHPFSDFLRKAARGPIYIYIIHPRISANCKFLTIINFYSQPSVRLSEI